MEKERDPSLPKVDENVNYFEILGLKIGATEKEIKKNYRKLARANHPDINHFEGAEENFKRINEAYLILTNETTKREYKEIWEAQILHEERKKKMSEMQRKMREKLERREKEEEMRINEKSKKDLSEEIKKSGGYDLLYKIQKKFNEKQEKEMVEKHKLKKSKNKFTRNVKVRWKDCESNGKKIIITKKCIKELFSKEFGPIESVKKKKTKTSALISFLNESNAVDACLRRNCKIGEYVFVVKPVKEKNKMK